MLNDCLEKWNKYINAYRNKLPSELSIQLNHTKLMDNIDQTVHVGWLGIFITH